MPASTSIAFAHTRVADHGTLSLVPFPGSGDAEEDVRDLAPAWQLLANGEIIEARRVPPRSGGAGKEHAGAHVTEVRRVESDSVLLCGRKACEARSHTLRVLELNPDTVAQPDLTVAVPDGKVF